MALQDSLSSASITLTRAQSTLDYIFDALVGPQVAGNGADKPYSSSINGNAQNLADRLEQFESQLNGLREALVTPTPVSTGETEAGYLHARNLTNAAR